MKPINAQGFEALFQRSTDPWNYSNSQFEQFKRRELLRACGVRTYGRALELACANGETSRALASRCRHLLAVDSSPTVIAAARQKVRDPRVNFAVALLPDGMPSGAFDLIVASEILYYLPLKAMIALLQRMRRSLEPRGRIVLVHHTVNFDDASQAPRLAQERAIGFFKTSMRPVVSRRFNRFWVAAFEA